MLPEEVLQHDSNKAEIHLLMKDVFFFFLRVLKCMQDSTNQRLASSALGALPPPPQNTHSIPEFFDALTSELGKAFSYSLNIFFPREQRFVCLGGKTTVRL